MSDRPGDDEDPEATRTHRPAASMPKDPDATVVHRPGVADSMDPDATVVGRGNAPREPGADETVMQRSAPIAPDPEATVMHRPGVPDADDPESTVMHRPLAPATPDPDSSIAHRTGIPDAVDPEATALQRPADRVDEDATVMHRIDAAASDDPESTILHAAEADGDADATVLHGSAPPQAFDPDETVARRSDAAVDPLPRAADARGEEPDPDATVARRGPSEASQDPEATVARRPATEKAIDADATVARAAASPSDDDPGASIARSLAAAVARRASGQPGAPAAGGAPEVELDALSGLNPLVALANPLLAAVPQMRWAVSHPDPTGLRATMLERLRAFEHTASARGMAPGVIEDARFALAALIDETVRSTPWGASSDWSNKGLLALEFQAHDDRDRFFDRLEVAQGDVAGNIELLELFAICLALGYEGRMQGAGGGRAALATLRDELIGKIRVQRGLSETLELSPQWRGVETVRRALPRALALWVAASICALLIGGSYFVFRARLSDAAQPIFADLARTKAKPSRLTPVAPEVAPINPAPAPAPASKPALHLAELLKAEVAGGLVEVQEDANRSVVTINAPEMFASGGATIEPRLVPVVKRIAAALEKVPGRVTVTGHTDSRPIRTARFPSNWELSRTRAESVSALIAPALSQPGRLRTEGVADSEPVAPNDSEANRRRNRRVVVALDHPS